MCSQLPVAAADVLRKAQGDFPLSHGHPKAPSASLGRDLTAGSVPGRIQVKITLQSSELDSAKPGFPLPSGDERIWDTPAPEPQSGCPEGPFGPGCCIPETAIPRLCRLQCLGNFLQETSTHPAGLQAQPGQSHPVPRVTESQNSLSWKGPTRISESILVLHRKAPTPPRSLCWKQRVTWSIFKNIPHFELPEGPSSWKAPGNNPDSFASAWPGAGIPFIP